MPETEFKIDANDSGLSLMGLGSNMPISLNETLDSMLPNFAKSKGFHVMNLGD